MLLTGIVCLFTIIFPKVPEHYTPPAPITAPIMTPLGEPQPVAAMQLNPQQQQQQQLPPHPAGVSAPFNPMQQQPMVPSLRNPAMPSVPIEGPPGAPTGDVIQVFKIQLIILDWTRRQLLDS